MDIIKLIVVGAVILTALFLCVITAKSQKNNIIEWLLWAVSEAEKSLGSGTGQLKLRQVYDWFVKQYPIISKIIPFCVFSQWVDIALGEMKHMLEANRNAATYIGGDDVAD